MNKDFMNEKRERTELYLYPSLCRKINEIVLKINQEKETRLTPEDLIEEGIKNIIKEYKTGDIEHTVTEKNRELIEKGLDDEGKIEALEGTVKDLKKVLHKILKMDNILAVKELATKELSDFYDGEYLRDGVKSSGTETKK